MKAYVSYKKSCKFAYIKSIVFYMKKQKKYMQSYKKHIRGGETRLSFFFFVGWSKPESDREEDVGSPAYPHGPVL